jgi:hypothetical protein
MFDPLRREAAMQKAVVEHLRRVRELQESGNVPAALEELRRFGLELGSLKFRK